MTHADIIAVIHDTGGRLVASFELDEYGRTVGEPSDRNRPPTCSICGEAGHINRGCPTTRTKPEKIRDRVREVIARHSRPDDLDETRRILAERAAKRRK